MYRYLDRPLHDLDEPTRFVTAAMRQWVAAARGGDCPCRALLRGFVARGVPDAVAPFNRAMAALDRDGIGTLRVANGLASRVEEDEARILTLFDAALAGAGDRVWRLAATLVADVAVPRLSVAVEFVALRLSGGVFLERDR